MVEQPIPPEGDLGADLGPQGPLTAQVSVLGSLLISPELTGEVLTKVRSEDFGDPSCRQVFAAIREQFLSGGAVDPVAVLDRLGGGAQWGRFLARLMDETPTAANIWEYVPILRRQAMVRSIRQGAAELARETDPDKLAAGVARLNGLLVERRGVRRCNMEEMIQSFWERHSKPRTYVSWGLSKLDEQLFADLGDMVVLGGYPSAGKTALAVSFAYHQAGTYRVGFYSLETSRYKLADRLISNLAGLEMGDIKRSALTQEQWQQAAQAAPEIIKRQLTLIDAGGMTARDIRADAVAHRYQIVYVDYLQIVEPENERANRTEQVSHISRVFQSMGRTNGILVVPLSQLVRRDEAKAAEPTMHDLRESGQIEQDADAILLLYLEDSSKPNTSRRVLKLGKNKDGERGRMYLRFDGTYQRFTQSAVDCPAPAAPAQRWPRQRKQIGMEQFFGWTSYDEGDDPFQRGAREDDKNQSPGPGAGGAAAAGGPGQTGVLPGTAPSGGPGPGPGGRGPEKGEI